MRNNSRLEWALAGLFLTVASGFAVIPYFAPGFTSAHDAELSIYRLIEFDRVLRDGILFPRWAPDFFFGYGFPFFNYYAPLPYYLAEIPYRLGLGPADAVEVVFIIGVILSGFSMYLLSRAFSPTWVALVASVSYLYFPYHLVDAHFRGDLGELFSFVWFPLVLLAVKKLIGGAGWRYALLGAISYALLILTHNIMALAFSGLLVSYIVWTFFWQIQNRDMPRNSFVIPLARVSTVVILAFGLSAFFWVPAMVEKGEVQINRAFENAKSSYSFKNNFADNFISSSVVQEYGYEKDGVKRYRIEIGVLQQLTVLLSLPAIGAILLRRRSPGAIYWRNQSVTEPLFFVCFIGILVFLNLPVSLPLWENVPLMVYIQTPWRFLSLLGFSTSILIGFLISLLGNHANLQRAVAIIVIGLTLGSYAAKLNPAQVYWLDANNGLRGLVSYELLTQSIGTTAADEYLPLSVKARPHTSPLVAEYFETGKMTKARLVSGDGTLDNLDAKADGFTAQYEGSGTGDVRFLVPFFPGWKAFVDGRESDFVVEDPFGTMRVAVPAGKHEVALVFQNTAVRNYAESVSKISGLLLLTIGGVLVYRKIASRNRISRPTNKRTFLSGWNGLDAGIIAFVGLSLIGIQVFLVAPGKAPGGTVSYPLDAAFSGDIRLKGFEIGNLQAKPGDDVRVVLHWDLPAVKDENLSSFVHLVDPQQNAVTQQDKSEFMKQVADSGDDTYTLKVPSGSIQGLYRIRVGIYDRRTSKRLPILQEKLAVAPFQEDATYTTISPLFVAGEQYRAAALVQYASQSEFGPGIRFLGYSSDQVFPATTKTFRKGEELKFNLYWQAEGTIDKDYTIFLHLIGKDMNPNEPGSYVWGQKDGDPYGGFYPTSLWESGEMLRTPWMLNIRNDAPTGDYLVELGLYESWSGKRAHVFEGQGLNPGDSLIIGKVRLLP